MKNLISYSHTGVVSIICHRKDGSIVPVRIDPQDIERAASISGSWFVGKTHAKAKTEYCMTTVSENGRTRTVYLHRLLTGCASHLVVDHMDYNGLNCTQENMVVCTQKQNLSRSRRAIKRATVLAEAA